MSLAAVDRGEARVHEQVPPDDPLWSGTGVELTRPLDVDLTARSVGDGVLVRGALRTSVRLACRRCLVPVEQEVAETVDLLFEPLSEADELDVGGEVYPLPARGRELDLTGPLREQLLLQVPEFALCQEACRGLCPRCGQDLNEGDCSCVPETAPSPWDALRKIKLD
ncbi:MAG TPA: DUF177 domain-containing protein [Longimicrobiaceae bacterium]|nr:DUF177 domain-containing protein [Longimicrobiaceae bacterium]